MIIKPLVELMDLDKIICPSCGWSGDVVNLGDWGECPECGCENWKDPHRLLTLQEMLESDIEYNNVKFNLFLATLLRMVKE